MLQVDLTVACELEVGSGSWEKDVRRIARGSRRKMNVLQEKLIILPRE